MQRLRYNASVLSSHIDSDAYTGTGEQIILTSLARTMAMAVKASIEDADAVIRRVLVEEFYGMTCNVTSLAAVL
jgi:hypothetical protein